MSTRIILADDHGIMREGLRALLEKQPGIEVIAEAENGRTTVELSRELKPDVVIIDISMPDLNGIEATRQIIAESPGVKVIALSMHSDRKFVREMLSAGASGYMLKDSAFEELDKAISTVNDNQTYLSPGIADTVVKDYLGKIVTDNSAASIALTNREREVLQLFAEGKTTKQIASLLFVSIKTIETHRKQIMDKLGLNSIAELTKYAIREGLTSLEK
jgi:DNA-binding NarL/FixJ family response regulator